MSRMTYRFPDTITLATLPQLLAFHRATFGGLEMSGAGAATQPDGTAPGAQVPGAQQQPGQPHAGGQPQGPQQPDGVTDAEWSALGDAGRQALVREREARQAAERALAAARSRPQPPATSGNGGQAGHGSANGQQSANSAQAGQQGQQSPADPNDIAAIIRGAVADAVRPFQQAEEQRQAEAAAQRVTDAVVTAAGPRFHDATDALTGIDLASVTDGNGAPDPTRIAAALDDLLRRKPHLGKPADGIRVPAPGSPLGNGGGATIPLDDRVKATLARMQAAAGVKFADS